MSPLPILLWVEPTLARTVTGSIEDTWRLLQIELLALLGQVVLAAPLVIYSNLGTEALVRRR